MRVKLKFVFASVLIIVMTGIVICRYFIIKSQQISLVSDIFMYTAPIWCVALVLFFIYFAITRNWKLLAVAISGIIIGWPFYSASLNWNIGGRDNKNVNTLKVVNYNVSTFNRPRYYYTYGAQKEMLTDSAENKAFINEVLALPGDIKCLQEFYSLAGDPFFNVLPRLTNKSLPYIAWQLDTLSVNKSLYGQVIVSRFPIIKSGKVFLPEHSINGAMYADIVKDADTLRIINFHMQSTQLGRTISKNKNKGKKGLIKAVYYAYKKSMQVREGQNKLLLKSILESPYPVIAAGDLNNLPYSQAYHTLASTLKNSHEESGNGFGFTLNSDKLFFFRIDNQFYSSPFSAENSQVLTQYKHSQHYPLLVTYSTSAATE